MRGRGRDGEEGIPGTRGTRDKRRGARRDDETRQCRASTRDTLRYFRLSAGLMSVDKKKRDRQDGEEGEEKGKRGVGTRSGFPTTTVLVPPSSSSFDPTATTTTTTTTIRIFLGEGRRVYARIRSTRVIHVCSHTESAAHTHTRT